MPLAGYCPNVKGVLRYKRRFRESNGTPGLKSAGGTACADTGETPERYADGRKWPGEQYEIKRFISGCFPILTGEILFDGPH